MPTDFIKWLEIPVTNLERARSFYEEIFECKMVDVNVGEEIYPCFPNASGDGFDGALVQYDFTEPGKKGPLVYLNALPDMDSMLNRILSAGGVIMKAKTIIAAGMGYFAFFEDSEGNLLALQGDK